jgi:hypothetical protein
MMGLRLRRTTRRQMLTVNFTQTLRKLHHSQRTFSQQVPVNRIAVQAPEQ